MFFTRICRVYSEKHDKVVPEKNAAGACLARPSSYACFPMKRTGSAVWQGDLKQGQGSLTTPSGVLKQTAYSFHTRFEDGKGTNPEELIAAAHAGCFSMALSAALGKAGHVPTKISTTATVALEMVNGNPTITTIDLDLQAVVLGIDEAKFLAVADDAKANCPVSRVLNAKISLNAKLSAT